MMEDLDQYEPIQMQTAINLKVDKKKLKELILGRPAQKMKRPRSIHFQDLTDAGEHFWENYLEMCEDWTQDHAKMYIELQAWAVDWDWDYELEMRRRQNIGRTLGTDHSTVNRDVRRFDPGGDNQLCLDSE